MILPDVDGLHHALKQFAENTNDIVCSAATEFGEFGFLDTHPSSSSSCASARPSKIARRWDISSIMNPEHAQNQGQGDILEPPTLRPKLPVEILDSIFAFLTHRQLQALLLTNSIVGLIARRRFYHTVIIDAPTQCVSFLLTLLNNSRLPPLVRSLDVNVSLRKASSTSTVLAYPIANFYRLFQRALRRMDGLVSLSLELPKSHSPLWMFDGCAFKLKQFTTSMHCHRPLARYLERQDEIEDLTLRGFQSDSLFFLPFVGSSPPHGAGNGDDDDADLDSDAYDKRFFLSDTALPRLSHFNAIHAGAYVVRAIVQGRPVEVASIPLFPETSLASLDALSTGSTSLKRLSVISFDPAAPGFLFEQLAQRFKELEAMHLVMLMADYSKGLLEESSALLANFKCLKYITFMAASNDESSSIDEVDIAKQWHTACPTLRTIILPKGRVWFQGEAELEIREVRGTLAALAGNASAG